jgi:eukaryotic-like serine/threonine-protein kinase
LNHPNIAVVHVFEECDGVHYLVLEMVPGETLAEKLAGGRLGVEEALEICRQIAEALEAAHEKEVIHRDLKPANIKVTPDFRVKVLDFGLAKAFARDATGRDPSQLPAMTNVGSGQGTILGTAAYMSTEQARGKPLDNRTDIWSFGCILYEALSGRRAFPGQTVSDTIAAILGRDPDWELLPATVPTRVRLLLRRCLQKESRHRLHDIADARIELEDSSPLADALPAAIGSPSKTWRVVGWAVTWLILGGIIAGVLVWNLKPSSSSWPILRIGVALLPGQTLTALDNPAIALSPDGTHLVYVGSTNGRQQLFLRRLDQFEARPVHGTEGAFHPFFSPDGEWIAFFADEKRKKVSMRGGAPVALCDAPLNSRGACWGPNKPLSFRRVQDVSIRCRAAEERRHRWRTSSSEWTKPGKAGPRFCPVARRLSSPLACSPDGGTTRTSWCSLWSQVGDGHWWEEPMPGMRRLDI